MRAKGLLLLMSVLLALGPMPCAAAPFFSDKSVPLTPLRGAQLLFVENAGQFDPAAHFQVWGGPASMWLAEDAIWITVLAAGSVSHLAPGSMAVEDTVQLVEPGTQTLRRGANLKISFAGANSHPRLESLDRLDAKVSYFDGNVPENWRTEVPIWKSVGYAGLYPGIDLLLGGDSTLMLPWQFELQPGADASAVRLQVEGADSLALDRGDLHLTTAVGEITLPLPLAEFDYQVERVASGEVLESFTVSPTARRTSWASNPEDNSASLLYSTFLGGGSSDAARSVTVDSGGSAYVVGETYSVDFPTTPGAFDRTPNGDFDAFVIRLSASGAALDYATFLGGNASDGAYGIAVDAVGHAYVVGDTQSANFPTTSGGFDTSFNGQQDGFVVRLNAIGTVLDFSTFVGGSNLDYARSIKFDDFARVYVGGPTYSSDFPTTPMAYDTTFNGGSFDAYLLRLNAAGSALDYSTYLGGSDLDGVGGVDVDDNGRVYVAGTTASYDFPTTPGAFDTTYNGAARDGFAARLSANGSALEYSTFLGGFDLDYALSPIVDQAGLVTIPGHTASANFPTTPGAYDVTYNGELDAFVVRLNSTGSALEYGTFLGGSNLDYGCSVAIDDRGRAITAGWTWSNDLPTTATAFDRSYNGAEDAFVIALSDTGRALEYGTYLGSGGNERAWALAAGETGLAYVVGLTESDDFPTTPNAYDIVYGGNQDAFASELAVCSLTADFDGDGRVEVDDLSSIALRWRQTSADPGWDPRFDLRRDNVIDIVDIQLATAQWGWTCF